MIGLSSVEGFCLVDLGLLPSELETMADMYGTDMRKCMIRVFPDARVLRSVFIYFSSTRARMKLSVRVTVLRVRFSKSTDVRREGSRNHCTRTLTHSKRILNSYGRPLFSLKSHTLFFTFSLPASEVTRMGRGGCGRYFCINGVTSGEVTTHAIIRLGR